VAWQLVDFPVSRMSAPVVGAKTSIVFPTVPLKYIWRVDAITAWAPQGAIDVLCFDQGASNAIPIDFGTFNPVGGINGEVDLETGSLPIGYVAVCDRSAPLTILGGDMLTITFFGTIPGDQVAARVQYQLMFGSAGVPTPVLGAAPPAIPVGI
jgi:hypothetical protein